MEGRQECHDEMKSIQSKIEQERAELNTTSTAYIHSLTLSSYRRTLT